MAHSHCHSCVLASCSSGVGCKMAACPQCDVCLHSCKLADHVTNICPETVIPCINSIYGCKKTTKRRLHWTHFEHCPAWITQCVFFYERLPVWSEKSCMEPDHPFDLPDAKFLLDDLELMSMTDSSVESECSGNQRKYQLFPSNVATISMNLIRADKSMWRLHAIGCKNYFNDGGLHSTQGYYRHTRIRNSSSYTPIYVFSCGQFIRRDEVSSHYHNHNDFATEGMSLKICGCPLRTYGCPYRTVQYTPSGSMLDYHSHAGSFVLRPQQIVVPSGSTSGSMYEAELTRKQELAKYGYNDWEGSLDYLGQLPVEILILIMEFLDSLSLWCLSQVNQYLRSVAREVATSKGIVYMKWNKCDSKWKQGPKIWTFTKTIDHVKHWKSSESSSSVVAHLPHCQTYQDTRHKYTPDQVWDLKTFSMVAYSDANFRRNLASFKSY